MDPDSIWTDFLIRLENGSFSPCDISPYPGLEALTPKLAEILLRLKDPLLAARDRGAAPEVHASANQVHFLLPLGQKEPGEVFCFSFVIAEDLWRFRHVENITIRLDQTGPPPVSTFPDIPEIHKAWIRDEIQASEMARLFNFLRAEKGREFALNWFRDGAGYILSARAWVPFLPLPQAFIYYACWDLANLHGNPIKLEQLDECKALVAGKLRYFELYQRASHLEQRIAYQDYRAIFETLWKDRAVLAGWDVQITIDGAQVLLAFQPLAA